MQKNVPKKTDITPPVQDTSSNKLEITKVHFIKTKYNYFRDYRKNKVELNEILHIHLETKGMVLPLF